MLTNLEIEVSVLNNASSESIDVGEYGAEVAKEYADLAYEYAEAAKASKNLAEAWAESSDAPTGEGTRSAKTWADVARQWAESETEPDGIEGAKSSKTWQDLAHTYANNSAASALSSKNSADASALSAAASENSRLEAQISEANAATSATAAAQSADEAEAYLYQLEHVDLPKKADLESPTFTGSPKAPTAAAGTNSTVIATTAFVQNVKNGILDSAPSNLNTLKKLATAIGNDAAFSTTVNNNLNLKANIASPTFTGSPKVPDVASGNSTQLIANTKFVMTAIANLVASAPGTLDTLNELALALGNDPNFATTITTLIGTKLDKTANAVSATKATQDEDGNNIVSTYATKSELSIISAAIGDDTDFITTITTAINNKLDKTANAVSATKATQDGSGNNIVNTYATKTSLSTLDSSLKTVAKSGSYNDLLNRPTIPTKTSQLTNDSNFVSKDSNGNVTISGTLTAAKVVNAYYNDYAEFFQRGEATIPGDIIALASGDKEVYVKATEDSALVVGVHSDEFAYVIGGETDEDGNIDFDRIIEHYIPVALAGRVHVRFYGPAVAGMKVVPSEIPGVGRAFKEGDNEDNVVGRIVAGDDFQNLRRVKIMVRRY